MAILKNAGYHPAKYLNNDVFEAGFDFGRILGEPDILNSIN